VLADRRHHASYKAKDYPPRRPEDLTVREQRILELIWKGMMNREIAARLKIGTKTVETHCASMMKKIRVSNTAQLFKAAIEQELLSH
jgi:DNA-binding NarL/FixJ family response regulator